MRTFLYRFYGVLGSVIFWRDSEVLFEGSAEIEGIVVACGAGDVLYRHFGRGQHLASDLKTLCCAEGAW